MQQILLASGNPGKLEELQTALKTLPVTILSQPQLDIVNAPETGSTFVENALLKARHGAERSSLATIADDSGLLVDYLAGTPGIYSARYAGEYATDQDNNQKLLDALKDAPENKRQAQFYCVLVYLRHAKDPMPIIAEGHWYGHILTQPRGQQGFGYDPLFCPQVSQFSAAQLDPAVKNCVSHRGQAVRQLLAQLTHLF
jgi:XTP/dITP diphosphohydrolase